MVMETLGPEPLEAEFTPAALRERAYRRSAPIKAVLLDQTVLAGMGNLYTDEALHYARIHPLRPANKLKAADYERLHAGIIEALRMGIDGRGSSLGTTLRDHVNVDGDIGRNQETVRAYGREGEPCFVCGDADASHQGRRAQQHVLPEMPASAACANAPSRAASKKRAKPRLHAQARRVARACCGTLPAWTSARSNRPAATAGGRCRCTTAMRTRSAARSASTISCAREMPTSSAATPSWASRSRRLIAETSLRALVMAPPPHRKVLAMHMMEQYVNAAQRPHRAVRGDQAARRGSR